MREPQPANLTTIACSVFRRELVALQEQGLNLGTVEFTDSMLHLEPRRLYQAIHDRLKELREQQRAVLLVFGDCHPFMCEMASQRRVSRTGGLNCIDLLIGASERKRLLREGVFFLLPEWTTRWREVFHNLLGLPETQVPRMVREAHRKLVYLDPQLVPCPAEELRKCSQWIGLPVEVMPVTLDHFRRTIENALKDLGSAIE